MVDLIVEKYCNQFTIYEIRNGKKEKVEELTTKNYEDVIDFINENYDYARILCEKCSLYFLVFSTLNYHSTLK